MSPNQGWYRAGVWLGDEHPFRALEIVADVPRDRLVFLYGRLCGVCASQRVTFLVNFREGFALLSSGTAGFLGGQPGY